MEKGRSVAGVGMSERELLVKADSPDSPSGSWGVDGPSS